MMIISCLKVRRAEKWPCQGFAAQLWPPRLSQLLPGHLGACWRLRVPSHSRGCDTAAPGWAGVVGLGAPHWGLQASVGQEFPARPFPSLRLVRPPVFPLLLLQIPCALQGSFPAGSRLMNPAANTPQPVLPGASVSSSMKGDKKRPHLRINIKRGLRWKVPGPWQPRRLVIITAVGIIARTLHLLSTCMFLWVPGRV